MALQAGKCFDGLTTLTHAHDSVQFLAGNATWVNQFSPVVKGPEKYVEVLLWLFYRLRLCCGIVGQCAMYIGSKVTSHPNLITIYTAYHPQKLSSKIAVLLQISHTPAFSLASLDFVFVSYYSRPGENIHFTVRHEDLTIAVRIVCVDCVSPCGPRSNLNLVHCMWSTFAYYCSNYAIVVVPSRTSGDKILYYATTRPRSEVRILVLVGSAYGTWRTLACCITYRVENLILVHASSVQNLPH